MDTANSFIAFSWTTCVQNCVCILFRNLAFIFPRRNSLYLSLTALACLLTLPMQLWYDVYLGLFVFVCAVTFRPDKNPNLTRWSSLRLNCGQCLFKTSRFLPCSSGLYLGKILRLYIAILKFPFASRQCNTHLLNKFLEMVANRLNYSD